MSDPLVNHIGTVSIGTETITNFRFANDIDSMANRVKYLDEALSRYNMEINPGKTKADGKW